jgi:hypothetical protein
LLVCAFASPVLANKPPTDQAALVVMERQEFVGMLERYQLLTEERDHWPKVADELSAEVEALKEQSDAKDQIIQELTKQKSDALAMVAALEADRDQLKKAMEKTTWWSEIKDYLLTFLGGAAAIMAMLLFL